MSTPAIPLRLSVERLAWRLRVRWRRLRGASPSLDMATMIAFYERVWCEAARQLGATLTTLAPGLWRIERTGESTLIANYVAQLDDPVILILAGNKPLCHRLLANGGLPVPDHAVYTLRALSTADQFMSSFPGATFVVKPASGTSGARGVTTHVATRRECRRASALASLYCDDILIERWIPGESYRLLCLDGVMIHASRRRGHRVVADGSSTIQELLHAEGTLPSDADHDLRATLRAQGLRLHSTPVKGDDVLVRSAPVRSGGAIEARTVFDEDATRLIGPALREQAVRAARAIGSRFAGVDVITCDPAVPLEETGGAVNEINTTPGLHHHYGLSGSREGTPPALRVLERLLARRGSVAVSERTARVGA